MPLGEPELGCRQRRGWRVWWSRRVAGRQRGGQQRGERLVGLRRSRDTDEARVEQVGGSPIRWPRSSTLEPRGSGRGACPRKRDTYADNGCVLAQGTKYEDCESRVWREDVILCALDQPFYLASTSGGGICERGGLL